jgi:RluA family pseudouridine synthase
LNPTQKHSYRESPSNVLIHHNNLSIPVIAWGTGWIIVDKPSLLSVHNKPGADLCSILTSYIEANRQFADQIEYDSKFGVHAVHRLDSQTSGVILLACRNEIFRYFSEQFASRVITKKYIAVLHGHLHPYEPSEQPGIWEWPLSDKPGGRACPEGRGQKKKCLTRFQILEHSRHYTMIECSPMTGRKHQIRRHAKLAGHPIVGDKRYGTARACNYLKNNRDFNRHGLHAFLITILLPDKSEPATFQTSNIPEDIGRLFDQDQQSTK